jgi:diguanylate cyclase (GGDEF)-like protein
VVAGVELQLSISLGVAQLRATETGAASLVRRADAALYHAKDNGRDRVEAAP